MPLRRALSLVVALLAALCTAADRERTYDLIHVDWSLSFDTDKAAIFGDVTNTLAPFKATNEIDLDCGKLNVRRVTVNGQPAQFRHTGETLKVLLNQQASAGERLDIRVVYHGQPTAGVYFVPAARAYPATTGMVYTQGEAEDTRYWLPTWDFPNDKATTTAHITVKPGEYALSNGALERVDKHEDGWTYHWRMRQPHVTYLISFIVGEYEIGTEKWDGLDVMWLVPKGLRSMGESSFGGTADMVRFFSTLTGVRYPYAKFSQAVVSDYMFGGMENITMVTNTIGTLHEAYEKPLASSEGLVLHELAHQWFGDTVTCRDWSHIWTNEGWASFLPAFYVREKHGQDAYELARYGTLQGALGAALGSSRPMVSDDYQIPMDMFDGNAYGGGAARMFMLMDVLGEPAFWKATKAYLEQYKFQNVTTEVLFASFGASSGKDLEQFRKQWFYQAGAPRVTATLEGTILTLSQREPHFAVDVPVGVFRDGRWTMHTANLEGASVTIDLGPLSGAAVMVDPEGRLMMQIEREPDVSKEDVAAMLRLSPNAATKARLIPRMNGWTTVEKQAVYNSERSVPVKVAMLQAFGRGDEAFLIAESRVGNAEIAANATMRLSACEMTPEVLVRLRDVWENDKNPRLRAVAVRALAGATKDSSLADKAWQIQSTDEGLRLFALEWWVLNDPDRARQVCIQQLKQPLNEIVRVAAIRHLGRLKDVAGSREAYNLLVAVTKEGSFGALTSAINSLVQFGDKAALAEIEPLTQHSLFMVRRTAEGAVAALRAR